MRETILRRRTRISEIQVKGPSRELLRLQLEARERSESQQRVTWPDNYSGIGGEPVPEASRAASAKSTSKASSKHSSLCSFCGKTFDRRAALSTHLKSCPSKSSSSSGGRGVVASVGTRLSEADSRTSAMLENEESNSNSTDSFMAMLNREKSIQAKILEQEQQMAMLKPVVPATTTYCRGAGDKAPDGIDCQPELNKNKRKRAVVRKALQEHSSAEDLDRDDHWDVIFDTLDKSLVDDSVDLAENGTETNLNDNGDSVKIKKVKLSLDDDALTTDCTICDRKFANLSNLRRHVAMFHYREKKFGCKLCQFRAFRKVDVINHLTIVHKMNCDKEDSLSYVKSIVLDKNKFTAEKDKAIADAMLKMQQKLPVDIGADEDLIDDSGSNLDTSVETNDIIIPMIMTEDLDESMLLEDIEEYVEKQESTLEVKLEKSPVKNVSPSLTQTAAQQDPLSDQQVRVKRRGRPKGSTKLSTQKQILAALTPAPYSPESSEPPPKPSKSTKLVRHTSSNSSSSEEQSARRPVRNRIKPVNKDFVYDMSNLLMADDIPFAPILGRPPKRKPIEPAVATSPEEDFVMPTVSNDTSVTKTTGLTEYPPIVQIKGAAMAMAQRLVSNNRASFNRQPEIPVERPIIPAKIIALRRSVGSDWHIMQTPCPKPLLRRASNEQLFEKITRKKQAFDKMNNANRSAKSARDHSSDLPVDSNISQRHSLPATLTQSPAPLIDLNILDELLKSREPNHEQFVVGSLEMAVVKPLSPNMNNNNFSGTQRQRMPQAGDSAPRRKTLVERLAEIKTKKIQENMKKLNISNGDENQ